MNKTKYLVLFLICLTTILLFFTPLKITASSKTPIYIGIIQYFETWGVGYTHPWVRVPFVKKQDNWEAMPNNAKNKNKILQDFYPSPLAWTVYFNGKKTGHIVSRNSNDDFFQSHGYQEIVNPNYNTPKIILNANDFVSSPGRVCISRPLLLSSNDKVSDPDQWKLSALTKKEKKKLMNEFRRYAPYYEYCQKEEQDAAPKLLKYSDRDIDFNNTVYRDKNGVVLAAVKLKESLYTCGEILSGDYVYRWYVLFPGGEIRFLSFATPVDAADFDHSGKSQWLFLAIDDLNSGYILYYDNFSKSVKFNMDSPE